MHHNKKCALAVQYFSVFNIWRYYKQSLLLWVKWAKTSDIFGEKKSVSLVFCGVIGRWTIHTCRSSKIINFFYMWRVNCSHDYNCRSLATVLVSDGQQLHSVFKCCWLSLLTISGPGLWSRLLLTMEQEMLVSFCLQLHPVMKCGDWGPQKKSISRNRICAF